MHLDDNEKTVWIEVWETASVSRDNSETRVHVYDTRNGKLTDVHLFESDDLFRVAVKGVRP